jgi:hypothetical protein
MALGQMAGIAERDVGVVADEVEPQDEQAPDDERRREREQPDPGSRSGHREAA